VAQFLDNDYFAGPLCLGAMKYCFSLYCTFQTNGDCCKFQASENIRETLAAKLTVEK